MAWRVLIGIAAIALVSLDGREDRLFSSQTPVELTISAPLQQLFENGKANEDYSVPAVISYHLASSVAALKGPRHDRPADGRPADGRPADGQPADGRRAALSGPPADVRISDVELSIRGNTSKRESECPFPKLKLKFKDAPKSSIFSGIDTLKIGTHCGENEGEQLTQKYGRLANEKSPWREALVYRLLGTVGVTTLLARPARITYIDTAAQGRPLVRNAMLVEDDDEAKKRLGAKDEIAMEAFTNAADRFHVQDAARLAFGEALAGNFDWCLKFTADDTYRCDERKPLWNVLAFQRQSSAIPVPKDFDLSGIVTGRHIWFDDVYNGSFAESPIDIEVISQVQRARTLFSRDVLNATRRQFLAHRAEAERAIAEAAVDPHGRDLAQHYTQSFFNAIGTDAAFYRPVVTSANARVYADAARSREACGPGETVPIGTPVAERGRSAGMAEVVLLDIMWQWAPPNACEAIHRGTVWIDGAAIGRSRPTANHEGR